LIFWFFIATKSNPAKQFYKYYYYHTNKTKSRMLDGCEYAGGLIKMNLYDQSA